MKKFLLILLTILMILCVAKMVMGNTGRPAEGEYYESVEIQQGDTIWEIAERYKPNDRKTAEYVKEIMEFNKTDSPNIKSGHHIIIPVVTQSE